MAGLNFYDLQPLAQLATSYKFEGVDATYTLSFCNDLPDEMACSADNKTMAVMNTKAGECKKLAGPNPTKNAEFAVGNTENNDGLNIHYSGGD